MRRRALRATLASLLGGAAALALMALAAAPAGAQGATVRLHDAGSTRYYLAVGASEAVGVQPSATHPWAVRTPDGYANDLLTLEAARWPGLRLVDLGCPGITAQGALDGRGGCAYPAGSEIATAVRFLSEHRGQTVLVTVDLGFNDLWPCLLHETVDGRCVDAALARVARTLPEVLDRLRAVGGALLLIVGLQHNDPFVADARFGAGAFARASTVVFDRFNAEVAAIYRGAGAIVANVPSEFGGGAAAPMRMCTLSWMCDRHNLHPNDAGYIVIADAVAEAIASRGTAGPGG